MTEPKTAQLRITARGVGEGQPGTKFWATPRRAQALIASAAAELVNSGRAPADTGILRRSPQWPLDRFSTVTPGWAGRAVALLGGGPSLTQEQVALVQRAREADLVRAVAINDAYLWAPFADILYAADSSWWAEHSKGAPKPMLKLSAEQVRERFAAFPGERCSIQNSGTNVEDSNVHLLRNANVDGNGRPIHGVGLSLDPRALVTGRNSGFQALNLAVLAGAKTIILLGYDGQVAKDGRTHWSGGHATPTPQEAYPAYREAMSAGENALKAAGVKVINASPESAINSFPKMGLAEALSAGA